VKSLEYIDIEGDMELLSTIHSVYIKTNQKEALEYLKSQRLPPKSLFTMKWGARGEEKILTPTSGGGVTMAEHDAVHACKCLHSGYTTKTILNKLVADHGNQEVKDFFYKISEGVHALELPQLEKVCLLLEQLEQLYTLYPEKYNGDRTSWEIAINKEDDKQSLYWSIREDYELHLNSACKFQTELAYEHIKGRRDGLIELIEDEVEKEDEKKTWAKYLELLKTIKEKDEVASIDAILRGSADSSETPRPACQRRGDEQPRPFLCHVFDEELVVDSVGRFQERTRRDAEAAGRRYEGVEAADSSSEDERADVDMDGKGDNLAVLRLRKK